MPTTKSFSPQSLAKRWNDVVEELREIRPMRPGTVCSQRVKYEDKNGKVKSHGPYPILTFKEKGKTVTMRLESEEKIEVAKEQIAHFRNFKEKTKELIDIGRRMADREMSEVGEGKKNSSKRSAKNKRPRRATSSRR